MKINLQAKNLELTPAIHDYVVERVTNLGKLLSKMEEKGGEVLVVFDVSKTTNHHKTGEIFRADCTITADGNKFYSSSDQSDLYAAVDDVKENLFHEITRAKSKKQHLFRRGAQKVKDIMRGVTSFGKK